MPAAALNLCCDCSFVTSRLDRCRSDQPGTFFVPAEPDPSPLEAIVILRRSRPVLSRAWRWSGWAADDPGPDRNRVLLALASGPRSRCLSRSQGSPTPRHPRRQHSLPARHAPCSLLPAAASRAPGSAVPCITTITAGPRRGPPPASSTPATDRHRSLPAPSRPLHRASCPEQGPRRRSAQTPPAFLSRPAIGYAFVRWTLHGGLMDSSRSPSTWRYLGRRAFHTSTRSPLPATLGRPRSGKRLVRGLPHRLGRLARPAADLADRSTRPGGRAPARAAGRSPTQNGDDRSDQRPLGHLH